MFGSLLARITWVGRNHHHSSRPGLAIEGLSMGGRRSTCLAMKYPTNYLGNDKARHIHND